MNNHFNTNLLNSIRTVVQEELTAIGASVTRIDENLASQNQSTRQYFNSDGSNFLSTGKTSNYCSS
ncbi:hypothetical protein [Phocaeicola paurosaccharolyticus]|uniref:hypothetical protein n=1 Tax=Phocaeicola paurosaccharolyticus TaxID=732242 RepID=UPI002FE29F25